MQITFSATVNPSATADVLRADRFATTRWSVVISSVGLQGDEGKAREALNQLCESYWRPVFAFICRHGHSTVEAQDLAQDFFVMVLEGNLLKLADPDRGRFRALLLKSLQNFLSEAARTSRARKRGGNIQFISWDDWMSAAPSRLSIAPVALESWSPERLFDLRWAATVTEHALRRLREECEAKGRLRVFDALSSCLGAERTDISYSSIAAALGVEESSVKKLLHRMRQRYRELLRAEVAETIADPADIDDEIRYLCAALAAGGT
jgi:RNA polymerase sigma factor (sigma-70 family)